MYSSSFRILQRLTRQTVKTEDPGWSFCSASRSWPGPVLFSIVTSIIATVLLVVVISGSVVTLTSAKQRTRMKGVQTLISNQRWTVSLCNTLLVILFWFIVFIVIIGNVNIVSIYHRVVRVVFCFVDCICMNGISNFFDSTSKNKGNPLLFVCMERPWVTFDRFSYGVTKSYFSLVIVMSKKGKKCHCCKVLSESCIITFFILAQLSKR